MSDTETNIILDIKVPKKRGRKPKKLLEQLSQADEVKVPKKRGRKPKKPTTDEVKIPKKRGRKPMLSQVTTNNKNISENFMTKDNVLHLKINSSEINNNILLDTLYKYNPDINDPQPYDPNNLCSKPLDDSNLEGDSKFDNHNYSIEKGNPVNTFTDNTNTNTIVEEIDTDYKEILKTEELSIEKNVDKHISDNINKMKSGYNNKKRKTNAIMIFYNEYNKRKEWPKKSSINCFWCCHTFTNIPYALPTKMKNDIFYVYGNFCSKECSAAYNFESGDNNNNIWERYTLLNYLYSLIEEDSDLKIKLAPHRMTLEMFGGNLSIEEFRETFNTSKNYKVVFPPMVSIIPSVEENNKQDNNRRNDSYYIPIDKERIKKANNDLRLKRKNPINNRNTLENCMRLKYT